MTRPTILFSAFEPSGDALAAPVIETWHHQEPGVHFVALGGPRMQQAGAELLESTTGKAVMLTGAVAEIQNHRRRLHRLTAWLKQHPIDLLVCVDSPAPNWSVCKLVRKLQPHARIAHLAAPQLWAWAPWRIGKMRRLSDLVLCLLPFEPAWFESRGMPARFVGHPIFQSSPEPGTALDIAGSPRIALLPGSRDAEITANWPTMRTVVAQLRAQHPELIATVAAVNEHAVRMITRSNDDDWLQVIVGRADDVLRWADVVLVVSGTATLQVAARAKPMVVMFNVTPWKWHLLGRWLIKTRTFSLPNLISESLGLGRCCPEFVPHFGRVLPLQNAMSHLLDDEMAASRQLAVFQRIKQVYADQDYAAQATRALRQLLDTQRPD